jgi:serine protease
LVALVEAGVEIINKIKGTDFFAVCVDSEEETVTLLELTDVDEIEVDPIRTLSHLPESEVIVDHRELQAESVPYGIDAVKAPEFWAKYSKRGEGVQVCVVDTGLKRNHEDIAEANVSGPPSSNNDLVTPWNEDGNGHGSHVTGTIAAEDNNRGVIGVAPGVSIFVARGT